MAWSVWLVAIGFLFFIARDNADAMMELEGIDLMSSNQKVMPMPVKDYREYPI